MRLLLDANVLLDCLVLDSNGQARSGKVASERVIDLCDQGIHQGLAAWHTLPIVSRQSVRFCITRLDRHGF